MAKTIMITSAKGGVGKSTVCANLGFTLARLGERVLLIDLDLGMRCLDLILALEDKALYDICDVVRGLPASRAAVSYPACERLSFIAAPTAGAERPDGEAFRAAMTAIKESGEYDFIIIDTPGDIGYPFELACAVCDAALVVASHGPSTIRAAEHTGAALRERGVTNMRLIINNYDTADSRHISRGERAGLIDIIDRTYLQLVGVIPYDAEFARAQERGELVGRGCARNVRAAFDNIARRIQGEQVSLFRSFKHISKKKLM